MRLLFVSPRSATVLLDGAGDYFMPSPASLCLNGQPRFFVHRDQAPVFI